MFQHLDGVVFMLGNFVQGIESTADQCIALTEDQ